MALLRPATLVRRHELRRFDADLPRFAEAVARELRAGTSLVEALIEAGSTIGGPLGADVDRVARDVGAGRPLTAALEEWQPRRRSDALGQLLVVVRLTAELGGRSAPSFDAVGSALRDRAELGDEIRSLTSQSRASAALLTGLPPIAAVGLAAIEPATGRFLVASAPGLACTLSAVVLTSAGWWWMGRLTGADR